MKWKKYFRFERVNNLSPKKFLMMMILVVVVMMMMTMVVVVVVMMIMMLMTTTTITATSIQRFVRIRKSMQTFLEDIFSKNSAFLYKNLELGR
jgi:sensor histidine kinase YesM